MADAQADSAPEDGREQGQLAQDPLLAERLDAPGSPEAIYLEEASIYRPVATGDIFRAVPVPGSTAEENAHDLSMLVAHPSAMRRGPELEERIQAAPVIPKPGMRRTAWSGEFQDVFHLPLLRDIAQRNGFDIGHKPWAADLLLCGPIKTVNLDVRMRVACLSLEGTILLLQRLVHSDTRAAVRFDVLADVFRPKLDEIELFENWNEDLVRPQVEAGANLYEELATGAREFDEFMGRTDPRLEVTHREMLEDNRLRAEGVRLVSTEIRRRRGDT